MSEITSEADLISRSQRGDLDAFNQLVERYQGPVYNLCLRMLGSLQPAEDATQEAFISAYRHMERFRGGAFRSWLFRIASNACYDEMRRRRSRPAVSLDAPVGEDERRQDAPDPRPGLEEHAENAELSELLQAALAEIAPEQRLAVILCDVQGLDYAEAAEVMDVSLGTVKSRISRGRSRLRDVLRRSGELLPARFRQSSEG